MSKKTIKTIVPPIKCQGIKTKLVYWIKAMIPSDFSGVWIEPFMGSGVVAFNIRSQKAILADTNPHLINFYQAIKNNKITPNIAKSFLEKEGKLLENSNGEHYYFVHERFNEENHPLDFFIIIKVTYLLNNHSKSLI
jgi:DNA adenine methylase